ncbi:hypothetical protein [Cellulomonas soli]
MSARVRTRPGNPELPELPRPAGRVLDARLHLLDRQCADVDDRPVTTVDDLEVHGVDGDPVPCGDQAAVVTSLLAGPVLGTRILGGRPPSSRWYRLAWSLVNDVGTRIRLTAHGDDLDVTWTERWARDRVVGRIPGGRHDPG